MLIDVSNTNTIPIEIKKEVLALLNSLPKETTSKIKANTVGSYDDIVSVIDNYIGTGLAYNFYQDLITLFEQHELICYHSTKVLNKDVLLQEGLVTNEWEVYSKNIIRTFETLGVGKNDIGKCIDLIKKHYDWKCPPNERIPQLCFYSDLNLLNYDMSAGYEQFCENIGGELARDALKEACPKLYQYLRNNGKAYMVKFKIPFINIVDFRKDSIVYPFVVWIAGIYFWNYDCEIHYEGYTNHNIPPNDILELIPYTIDRYYFNQY